MLHTKNLPEAKNRVWTKPNGFPGLNKSNRKFISQNSKKLLLFLIMKKNILFFFLTVFITGVLQAQILFAAEDEESNKFYLEAYNMYKLGKLEQALEVLKKVVTITPDHAEAHFGMGSIYFRQNMFDDAVKEFTKVTKIKPEYVEAYQRLWLAYKKLGMNDRAEEELAKYKKLIEERMQAMGGGGAPQVAKPVAPPPPQAKEQKEKPKPEPYLEERKPVVARPSEAEPPETKAAESSPVYLGEKKEKPTIVKPVIPTPEESRSLALEKKPTVMREVKLPDAKPKEQPNVLTDLRSSIKLDQDYKSPYIKIDKKDPAYKSLFKPFRKVGSTLFRDPKKKHAEVEIKKPYFGKLAKGFVYYIAVVQIWLGVTACLCIYFFKQKKNR